MPTYGFETSDKKIEKKLFEVFLSVKEYDLVMAKKKALIHPDTGKPCKKWKRLLEVPNIAFTIPQESSKWDSFEYRAGFNLEKAKGERRFAESKSNVGTNPYLDNERIDLGQKDLEDIG